MYDLAILGGGPGGVAAGVYASRKRLKTILITPEFGGQSIVSEGIQNWIGTVTISGQDLAKNLEEHLKAYADNIVDIHKGESVEKVEKDGEFFKVTTSKGSYSAKAVLVTTGSHRRKLEVIGADIFDNKGITYCASCDGPLFSGEDVAVIGGGNAAFETAAQLLAYTKSVTLFNRTDKFKADEVTVQKVLSNPKMKAITNIEIQEVKGNNFVTSIVYKDVNTGQIFEMPTVAVFVEIGLIPTTGFVKDLVEMTDYNQIKIDPWNQRTSLPGIWAAGDCTNVLYHQNNIAAGDAVRALEDIYMYLNAR